MKFIRSTFSLITIAITRSPFLCSDRAQNFSRSKEHFWNLEVRCDWSKYSADAHVGGTRDESQRDSAGEARYNMVMSCHISHLQQSHLHQGIVAMISHTITISTT